MNDCRDCANVDNEYCFACDNGNQFKPMTNAERIRSMNDEELADFILKVGGNVRAGLTPDGGWLNWLKQEVET